MGVPRNLNQAVAALEDQLTNSDRQFILSTPNWDTLSHHWLGRHIRNEWGLWAKSPLARWFEETYELTHADDISAIILSQFYSNVLGKPFDIDKQVQKYKDHWVKYGQ